MIAQNKNDREDLQWYITKKASSKVPIGNI